MEPLSAGSSTVLEPDLSIINKAQRNNRMTKPEYFHVLSRFVFVLLNVICPSGLFVSCVRCCVDDAIWIHRLHRNIPLHVLYNTQVSFRI